MGDLVGGRSLFGGSHKFGAPRGKLAGRASLVLLGEWRGSGHFDLPLDHTVVGACAAVEL